MKNLHCILLLLCSTQIGLGQNVGINTKNPQAKLHVAGDFKFTPDLSVTATRLIGSTPDGDLKELPLSDEFNIVNGTLEITEIQDENIYLVGEIDQSPFAIFLFSWNNMDLLLLTVNEFNTVFRVFGETANYHVTGFADGFSGRIVYYYNSQLHNVTFKNLDPLSDSENQILTGTGGDKSINAEGVAEFVYDAVTQKWILVNIRT